MIIRGRDMDLLCFSFGGWGGGSVGFLGLRA